MLKVRIIPTLLFKDMGLVKGKQFKSDRFVGSVLPAMRLYNMRDVDELILLDVTATPLGNAPDFESIEEYTETCFVPLTVGGGVRSIEDIQRLLRAGADKVAINTAAVLDPDFINRASRYFGAQCIVVSIDTQKDESGQYYCYINCGRTKTNIKVTDWARMVEERGAGEILISSIERDGMMMGYDLELISLVTSAVDIPVIASGGAGEMDDFYKALTIGKAAAVAAASLFHFRQVTPSEVRDFLKAKGLPTRNSNMLEETV